MNYIHWSNEWIYVIGSASDGESALRMIRRHVPDIVIIDINMPDISGLRVIEMIRQEGLPTQFIILSGYEEFSYARQAMASGVTSYLLKPVNKEELLSTVRQKAENILQHKPAAEWTGGVSAQASLILQVATGRLHDAAVIRERMQAMRLNLPFEHLYVVAFQCERPCQDALITHIRSHLFCCAWLAFESTEERLSIVIHLSPRTGIFDTLRSLIGGILSEAGGVIPDLAAGIGTCAPTLMELPLSYHSANKTLQYQLYQLPGHLYDASIISTSRPRESINVYSHAGAISVDILHGDTDAALRKVSEFVSLLFYIETPPPDYLYGMCANLIIAVRLHLHAQNQNFPVLDPAQVQLQLQSVRSMEELRGTLDHYVLSALKLAAPKERASQDPLIQEALAYIRSNILNNLQLSDVANHVHLSENYFSYFFKHKMGKTFRSYVLRLKMEKARSLLAEQKMNISEVAELLGYEDYRAFTRAFKNLFGTTPSELVQQAKMGMKRE